MKALLNLLCLPLSIARARQDKQGWNGGSAAEKEGKMRGKSGENRLEDDAMKL